MSNVKRRRKENTTSPESSRRQTTFRYSLPAGNENLAVCRRTFMRLFSLSDCRLQHLLEFVKRGELVFTCNVGKNPKSHEHRRKYSEETRNSVILHVMAFPREDSHYKRAKTQKEYLSPDLNVARLYAKYKEENPNTIVSEKYYRRIFGQYFPDLKFRRPRTDTCGTCDKYALAKRVSSDGTIGEEHELHLLQAEKARTAMYDNMRASREPGSETFVLAMDLEKVLFVPTLTHSQMYYSRQLSVYNLCIHAGELSQPFMCMWHEGIAGRGANEVVSCLMRVLQSQVTEKRHSKYGVTIAAVKIKIRCCSVP